MTGDLAARGGRPYCDDLIPLHRSSFGAEEVEELKRCLESGWITKSRVTARFEHDFARWLAGGSDPESHRPPIFALGVNSCTAALHTALILAGVGTGDEVITTPMTFVATLNVIEHTGATPVLVDVHPDNLTINEDLIEGAISERTKAIIPVHYGGHPCEMDEIARIARVHNLTVIEDSAHAVEAVYRGRRMGTMSPYTCFSFYANKNLTTGEGGMLVLHDPGDLEKARSITLHGMSEGAWRRFEAGEFRHYDVEAPGFKYNMFDLQAALGIHQLKKLGGWLDSRKWLFDTYSEGLRDLPEITPLSIRPHVTSARHIFVARLDTSGLSVGRDEFLALLLAENVQGCVHYRPVFTLTYYREKYGWRASDYPVTASAGECVITLPLFPTMSETEVKSVLGALGKVLEATRR